MTSAPTDGNKVGMLLFPIYVVLLWDCFIDYLGVKKLYW